MTREVHVAGGEFADLSDAILRRGSSIRFQARGRSMLPLIRNGDVLIARPARSGDLRVGSVVLHRIGPHRLVAHRVVWRRASGGRVLLKTRGDASFTSADVVRPDQVLGCVVAVERSGRLVRLDRGLYRFVGTLWRGLWPLGPCLLCLVRGAAILCRKMPLGPLILNRDRGGRGAPRERTQCP